MLWRQIRDSCLGKYSIQVYLWRDKSLVPHPCAFVNVTADNHSTACSQIELVGCKSGYCSYGIYILPTDDLVTTLPPLIFRHASHVLGTYWKKLLDCARTASHLWASPQKTTVCMRCFEQKNEPCDEQALNKECVWNISSSTKNLVHRYWEVNCYVSVNTHVLIAKYNHCSFIIILPASSSPLNLSLVFKLPQKKEEKSSFHAPCKAYKQW